MLFALIVTSALFLYITMASALRNVVVVGGSYVGLVSFSLPFPTFLAPSVPTLRQWINATSQNTCRELMSILPASTHRILLIEAHTHFNHIFTFVGT